MQRSITELCNSCQTVVETFRGTVTGPIGNYNKTKKNKEAIKILALAKENMPVPSQDTKKQSCLVFSDVGEDTEHELKTERDCNTIFI